MKLAAKMIAMGLLLAWIELLRAHNNFLRRVPGRHNDNMRVN
jgi:hypothetical protein